MEKSGKFDREVWLDHLAPYDHAGDVLDVLAEQYGGEIAQVLLEQRRAVLERINVDDILELLWKK